MKDVPGTVSSGAEALEVEQPRIYFGEEFDGGTYSIVNTEQEEIDYASEDGIVRSQYAGEGGVELSSFVRRLAFAIRVQISKSCVTFISLPSLRAGVNWKLGVVTLGVDRDERKTTPSPAGLCRRHRQHGGPDAHTGPDQIGVAPDAHLIGYGSGDLIQILTVLAAFDHILAHHDEWGIRVVNNSWGASGRLFDPEHPVNVATEAIAGRGTTVVFAAGNDFLLDSGFHDEPALVVSATDSGDGDSDFSNDVGDAQWGSRRVLQSLLPALARRAAARRQPELAGSRFDVGRRRGGPGSRRAVPDEV